MAAQPVWAAQGPGDAPAGARDLLFDADWRFFRGDASHAEYMDFDDGAWRRLDLPHDWSIEDLAGNPTRSDSWAAPAALWNETTRPVQPGQWLAPQVPKAAAGGPPLKAGPFDAETSAGGFDTGWTVGGTGWYRKRFTLGAKAGDQVELRFDGAFMLAEVWLNGAPVGSHFNGFAPFAFDLTPHLDPGGDNLLAVRVRNEGKTSRWYSGSGLYRHVWLVLTGPVRLPHGGVSIATPLVSGDLAKLTVSVEVENRTAAAVGVQVQITAFDPKGQPVASLVQPTTAPAGQSRTVGLELDLADPALWSPDQAALYRLETSLSVGGRPVDRQAQRFGVRRVEIDAAEGLRINGQAYKLKGACLHHDNGLIGAAAIDRAETRKVELLKAKGFNAVRCSHNAYSPAFLDACDALGMLVIDEFFDAWEQPKRPDDYAKFFADNWRRDLEAIVRRDRNHPCVILWSIGNEIPECARPRGVAVAAALREAVLALDPSRAITAALAPGVCGPGAEPARRGLDVVGYNYMAAVYEADHADSPQAVFMGTEQCAQYMHDAWRKVEAYPWVIGDFVWTGMDYLGEVGSGSSQLRPASDPMPPADALTIFLWDYPALESGSGDLDLIGLPKPQSFYRDVLWRRSPVELFVQRPPPAGMAEQVGSWGWHDELKSWTWPVEPGEIMTVRAYSFGDEVRLLLDGRELGRKALAAEHKLTAAFQVPYRPGELTVVALDKGVEIGRASLVTVGPPARVRLRPEADAVGRSRNELFYAYAEVVDAQDRLVPDAMVPLAFRVGGAAELVAAGSANPRGVESFSDPFCRTFHGVAQLIARPLGRAGAASLEVVAPGLKSDRLRIQIA